MMNAQRLSQIDRLRARDGDDCWWCFRPINFQAPSNSKAAPSVEHRTPLSLGGSGRLDNLLLCHPGCNRQLRDWPRDKKDRARAKKLAKSMKQADSPASTRYRIDEGALLSLERRIAQWQLAALVGGGAALLFGGIAIGALLR